MLRNDFKLYGRQTYLVHKFDGLFTECDAWLVSSYFEMLTISGTLDLFPFGEFMVHPFIVYEWMYIYIYIYYRIDPF